jgi:flavin-dependent dehydrogenase
MYDAIVIGARCAGSATAMLLPRRGYSVLLVDRAGFPSDTISTHYIHQPGVALEMQQLFAALRDDTEATDRVLGVVAGTVPIPEFFLPEIIGAAEIAQEVMSA